MNVSLLLISAEAFLTREQGFPHTLQRTVRASNRMFSSTFNSTEKLLETLLCLVRAGEGTREFLEPGEFFCFQFTSPVEKVMECRLRWQKTLPSSSSVAAGCLLDLLMLLLSVMSWRT